LGSHLGLILEDDDLVDAEAAQTDDADFLAEADRPLAERGIGGEDLRLDREYGGTLAVAS
jgi:hypothetical protein